MSAVSHFRTFEDLQYDSRREVKKCPVALSHYHQIALSSDRPFLPGDTVPGPTVCDIGIQLIEARNFALSKSSNIQPLISSPFIFTTLLPGPTVGGPQLDRSGAHYQSRANTRQSHNHKCILTFFFLCLHLAPAPLACLRPWMWD